MYTPSPTLSLSATVPIPTSPFVKLGGGSADTGNVATHPQVPDVNSLVRSFEVKCPGINGAYKRAASSSPSTPISPPTASLGPALAGNANGDAVRHDRSRGRLPSSSLVDEVLNELDADSTAYF